MRSPADAQRALALGAPKNLTHTTGNTKFDHLHIPPNTALELALLNLLKPTQTPLIWVAGSTHEGEEEILLATFKALKKTFPSLQCILAPRYIERTESLLNLCQQHGLTAAKRTDTSSQHTLDILVLDTVGELRSCYCLATAVFVGGSFIPRGGQNILEPAACAKPVVCGPHMFNFEDALQLLLGHGVMQVTSQEQLQRVLHHLFSHPKEAESLGLEARTHVHSVSGAATRNAQAIAEHVKKRF
jgi:3-deoxy-D-manno-octulosonic-acid transferase